MLKVTDLRGQRPTLSQLRRILPRGGTDVDAVLPVVAPVVAEVRDGGAAAALSYGQTFDGVTPSSIRVPDDVINAAWEQLDPAVLAALELSRDNIATVHAAQVPESSTTKVYDSGSVREKFIPISRVGLYVPGGKAVYPSSVLMNVIPAQMAGVGSLVVASPPQKDFGGWPHPTILAACKLLGVDEVWAVGGAQAVALLAYGDEDSDEALVPVDMITGPGNIYVTAAKRLCRSVVGIDSEAGPTEIAVLADGSADPVCVAYDLISQAEHDPMAASVLITDDERLAERVNAEVAARYSVTLNHGRVEAALTGEQSGIVIVDDIDTGIAVADAYAAEHLEIHTTHPREVADRISNAGAIFVGSYSPVPLGDYSAGSNHVLPTSGCARHSSGLSTHTFLKAVNLIEYDETALKEVADAVVILADEERLPAHGEAIKARFTNL